jgi:RNA polymerase sigma-70 factor (ECF subfamily)
VDEELLWPRIRQGDQRAFQELFNAHYENLCFFAHRYLQDRDSTEDLVQEIFVKIWDKADQIDLKTKIRPYLYSSVRNACLNQIKHEKVKQEYASSKMSSFSFEHSDSMEVMELEDRIAAAIESLPEKCREVFELSRFAGKKYAEIADELDISVKTVENQMGKALRVLRSELQDYYPLLLIGGSMLFLGLQIGVETIWIVL